MICVLETIFNSVGIREIRLSAISAFTGRNWRIWQRVPREFRHCLPYESLACCYKAFCVDVVWEVAMGISSAFPEFSKHRIEFTFRFRGPNNKLFWVDEHTMALTWAFPIGILQRSTNLINYVVSIEEIPSCTARRKLNEKPVPDFWAHFKIICKTKCFMCPSVRPF
jgi:hypothetical protein